MKADESGAFKDGPARMQSAIVPMAMCEDMMFPLLICSPFFVGFAIRSLITTCVTDVTNGIS
ncbi:MAG: hypothetical protein HY854_19760 [Burkholderiales bacterium]|nr:hypothetical protein [Burkholderiales bacterium]